MIAPLQWVPLRVDRYSIEYPGPGVKWGGNGANNPA